MLSETTRGSKAEASITYEKAGEQAWNEIETHLRAMPPYDMQDLVAGLLKALAAGAGAFCNGDASAPRRPPSAVVPRCLEGDDNPLRPSHPATAERPELWPKQPYIVKFTHPITKVAMK